MSSNRRVLTYVAIALLVGAALALAVAVAGSDAGSSGAASPSGDTAASAFYSDDGTTALAAADPARQVPVLDKFTSKDPFIPFPTPGATTSPSASPSASGSPQANKLAAKVKVDGTSYSVMQGDKVPGGSAAAFTVSSITSDAVTFQIIDGELENGDKSFTVNVGEMVTVTEKTSGVSYTISVTSIGEAGTGGGSGGSVAKHSITVLSVSSQNGTPMVTLEVDGKTYSDKKVGAVISTSWGEIKVIAINVDAQTVTLLHGDQTITLRAGQMVIK